MREKRNPTSGIAIDFEPERKPLSQNKYSMRYQEIIEAAAAEKARKAFQKRKRAHEKFTDAQQKKSEAAQQFQDKLRKANDDQRSAQAAMRSA